MIELCFAEEGIVIGDREKHTAVDLTYGDMFRIVHQFLGEFLKFDLKTHFGKMRFQRLKEGDGSPYPIIAIQIGNSKTEIKQLRFDEVIGICQEMKL